MDQDEERPTENLTGLIGDISYDYDFPSYDLFDDDAFQTEDNLAASSLVDQWEENHFSLLPESTKPMQAIYDIDGESYDSIIADEYSLNLHFALPQIISESRNHQPSFLEDEEVRKERILKKIEIKGPSLEKEEAMEQTTAQEYIDLFTELDTIEQNISELPEDSTAIYDESSSSENEEDEGDSLPQESLLLDPVEEEEILVEAYLPNIHNQVSFHDPYAHSCKNLRKDQRYF